MENTNINKTYNAVNCRDSINSVIKKTLVLLHLVAISVTGINAQEFAVDSSKAVTLRLDLKSARGMPVSELFDDVKFLPLETTSQSLFGEIYQLAVSQDCYIISDQDTRSILFFRLDGSFRNKIKFEKTGQDPPLQFKLVESSAKSIIEVLIGDNLFTYDLNGKLLKQGKSTQDYRKTAISFVSENIEVRTNFEISDKFYEIALIKNGRPISYYFPHEKDYTRKDQYMGSGSNITRSTPLQAFYKRFYDYNIYSISPQGLSLDYKLIFPSEYSLPSDFMTNLDFKNKRIEFLEKNRKIFYGLKNIYKSGDNLFFSGATLDISKSNKRDFILNLKTKNLTSLQDIQPDARSFYLPITNLSLNPDFSFHGYHLYKNDYLYNSIPSIDMMVLNSQNPNKEVVYDKDLANYFKTQTKSSNPVLVILKPKK